MKNLTPEGARRLEDVARRHGVSLDAVLALLDALAQNDGSQVQFNHPDLGGMGQWSQGGMIMVGDMFNHGLKHRVDALCSELAGMLRDQPTTAEDATYRSNDKAAGASLFVSRSDAAGQWWPSGLGSPASTGAQNLKYAYFPSSSRLVILQDRQVRVYDAGEHRISGVSQQQSGDQSLTFTSQLGLVRVADLRLVNSQEEEPKSPEAASEPFPLSPRTPSQANPAATTSTHDAIIATIERLAELHKKEILSEEEFAAKKAELLGRL
jgi:hypothetical protein